MVFFETASGSGSGFALSSSPSRWSLVRHATADGKSSALLTAVLLHFPSVPVSRSTNGNSVSRVRSAALPTRRAAIQARAIRAGLAAVAGGPAPAGGPPPSTRLEPARQASAAAHPRTNPARLAALIGGRASSATA